MRSLYWSQFMIKIPSNRAALADAAFLFAIEILSTLPYLFGLGFYTDDWNYQNTLVRYLETAPLARLSLEMIRSDPHFIIRPVQLTYLVLSFKVFGQIATLYRVFLQFNSPRSCDSFLVLALRELQNERRLAFVIAVILDCYLNIQQTDSFTPKEPS